MRMYEKSVSGMVSQRAGGRFFFLPTPHPLGRVDVRKKKRKGRTESEHIILIRQIENNGES